MKRLVTVGVFAIALLATAASAQSRTYTIDRNHSEVGFKVKHFFNKTYGQFSDFSGAIQFDPKNVAASTVEVTIRDSSINTENPKRDDHLRSEDFFWVEKHPTITFKSSKVVPGKSADNFQVMGDLTIRGVTKPVTLDVEFNGSGPVGIQGNNLGMQAGFTATTTVNRKDYGIVWNRQLDQGGVMLGDDVDITLSVAAVSRDPKPATPANADKSAAATDKK